MNTKILIVDDEIDIVLMLRSFFESKGYLVLFATNGEEALKQIERQPNIILLDINNLITSTFSYFFIIFNT